MTRPSTTVMLDAIGEALPLLPLLATTKTSGEGGGQVSAGSKPPLNLTPLSIAQDVHRDLVGWVRICHEDGMCSDDDWPADTPLDVVLWLRRHAVALDHHEAAADWALEVANLHGRCLQAIGERERRPPQLVCRRCHTAHLQGMDDRGRASEVVEAWRWMSCPLCGQTETLTDELAKLGEQPLTLGEYAAETGVPLRTLQWRVKQAEVTQAAARGRHAAYWRADLDQLCA